METLWMILALSGLAGCAALIALLRRQNKTTEQLSDGIEHFLLYPHDPPEETLAEGPAANLYNQISRLEQMLSVQETAAARREQQTTLFIENMAHQINNSLTALQIQLDILGLHTGSAEREALKKSQDCMDRLKGEIDRILSSGQLAEGKVTMNFEPLELREELNACRARLSALASSRDVEVRIAGAESLTLPADPFWLPQALENVIKNAVEHTAFGSAVTVTLADEKRNARISVEDEGDGIPAEELSVLFERFHRGETAKAGYGIGLSMAKDIVAAHHGKLSARNRERGGALFEIILPVIEGSRPYQ